MFKVDNQSVCTTCSQKVTDTTGIKCSECDCLYHAVCPSAAEKSSQICNSSFLSIYLKPSTKENFTWSCDTCKTESESNKVATLSQAINRMHTTHTAQITALTNLVQSLSDKVDTLSAPNHAADAPATGTIWDNRARVQKMNIPSAIVVKPDQQGNKITTSVVRKIATEQGIPINSVVEKDNGEMFVNLPDIETRDKVSQILEESHTSNEIIKLKSKTPTVAVMGVTARDMKKDNNEDLSAVELQEMIYKQNKSIANMIDKGSDLKVVFTRPPPRDKNYYTVVIRVSPDIRSLLKQMNDKIHIGVSVHNIVDRFHIKRCNTCQGLGHYQDKCDKSPVCGFCAKDHKSDVCPDKNKAHTFHKCINCAGDGPNASGHPAFWSKCPAYKAAQEKSKKAQSHNYSYLN